MSLLKIALPRRPSICGEAELRETLPLWGMLVYMASRYGAWRAAGVKSDNLAEREKWHSICLMSLCNLKQLKLKDMNIRPLADRVLVEPKEAETKTASGIYIPDTAKEKPQQGKVIAVGSGKKDEPMELKVGDTVLYGKYSGTEITVDGKDYLMMRQSDVLAVL